MIGGFKFDGVLVKPPISQILFPSLFPYAIQDTDKFSIVPACIYTQVRLRENIKFNVSLWHYSREMHQRFWVQHGWTFLTNMLFFCFFFLLLFFFFFFLLFLFFLIILIFIVIYLLYCIYFIFHHSFIYLIITVFIVFNLILFLLNCIRKYFPSYQHVARNIYPGKGERKY